MKTHQKGNTLLGLLVVIAAVAAIVGYVLNIVKLVSASGFDVLEMIRCLGIVIPFLGSVLGFVG